MTRGNVAFFLLGAALAIIAQGIAGPVVEIAVGRSDYCCLTDGVWWQSPMGFNGDTKPSSIEIGARLRRADFGAHLAYLDLGTATGSNAGSMRDDEFGRHDPARVCNAATQSNCLGSFQVRQQVAGILAGASYRYAIRSVYVEGELGQYIYRAKWQANIQCAACGEGNAYAFGYSHNFRYVSDIRRSNYISARVTYKSTFLMWRRFTHVDGGGSSDEQYATGLTSGPVNQIMVGVVL